MDSNLVFLCGFPSSGTDLLKSVINAHPEVYIGGEFPFLPGLATDYDATITSEQLPAALVALQQMDVYHNLGQAKPFFSADGPLPAAEYEVAELYAALLTPEPFRWKGNKTPQNTEHIDQLHHLFPRAKFIVIIRDVRDVALSWEQKWGKHKFLCAHKWQVRMQRGQALLQALDPDAFLIIKYEALLSDLSQVSRRICMFLGLEFEPAMLTYHTQVQDVIEGKLNYGKALIQTNANKWLEALSVDEIRRIEEIAYPSLQAFDYLLTQAVGHRPLTRVGQGWGYLWDIVALLVVGNRAVEQNRFRHRCKTLFFELRKLCWRMLTGRYRVVD